MLSRPGPRCTLTEGALPVRGCTVTLSPVTRVTVRATWFAAAAAIDTGGVEAAAVEAVEAVAAFDTAPESRPARAGTKAHPARIRMMYPSGPPPVRPRARAA